MSDFLLDEPPDQLPYFTGKEADPKKLFGRLCAGIRRSLGMSREKLASEVGLDPGQLETLERGLLSQEAIPREALVRLATILLGARYRSICS